MPTEVAIGIVGCAKRKRSEPCAARDLYISPLFQQALRYAETVCDATYVASALHDLVPLDRVIAPYDRTLKVYGKRLRMAWGDRVVEKLAGLHRSGTIRLLVLAGADYVEPIRAASIHRRWTVEDPLRGRSVAGRLQWLRAAMTAVLPVSAEAITPAAPT